MAIIEFDVSRFRALFPAFASAGTYPTATLDLYWEMACEYISPTQGAAFCGALSTASKTYALNLMTAHLAALNDQINTGQVPTQVNSSTVDKVSVSLTMPPNKTQWQWWLNLTPYGAQLLAFLQSKRVGGFYMGGLPELAAFRRVGGLFEP